MYKQKELNSLTHTSLHSKAHANGSLFLPQNKKNKKGNCNFLISHFTVRARL